jgi:hypothetical protein
LPRLFLPRRRARWRVLRALQAEYWERLGYSRRWGDAAVMYWQRRARQPMAGERMGPQHIAGPVFAWVHSGRAGRATRPVTPTWATRAARNQRPHARGRPAMRRPHTSCAALWRAVHCMSAVYRSLPRVAGSMGYRRSAPRVRRTGLDLTIVRRSRVLCSSRPRTGTPYLPASATPSVHTRGSEIPETGPWLMRPATPKVRLNSCCAGAQHALPRRAHSGTGAGCAL